MGTVKILRSNYSSLGQTKVARVVEYALLFPEYAQRFVFLGDDGQADLEASEEMLGMRCPSLKGCRSEAWSNHFMFAFVAIHAVRDARGVFKKPEQKRNAEVARIRAKYCALKSVDSCEESAASASHDRIEAPQPDLTRESRSNAEYATEERHRFFYFADYTDLAMQLVQAGWLNSEQGDAVVRASVAQTGR